VLPATYDILIVLFLCTQTATLESSVVVSGEEATESQPPGW
jgi:hypothetical protein